ncbi:MAG: CDP-archaeol synthase [Gammaproteobacteria bacterium]|nr:CDP-archaeol synthase [Gammaproteobacteria bacterium]
MLKYRLLTAAVLIPLVILGIFKLPPDGFAAILGLLVTIGAWEWSRLCGLKLNFTRAIYLIVFMVCLFLVWVALESGSSKVAILVLSLSLGWWLLSIFILAAYQANRDILANQTAIKYVIGLILLIPVFVALLGLRNGSSFGPEYVMYLLLLIWVADSTAYFTGRQWGKHKLLPKVSPGKTWEGVAGASVGALLVSVSGAFYFELPLLSFVILSMLITAISIVGDLTESLFKRQVQLKDSGTLLPGHGGMLDRIDSLTSAAPFFLAGMLWITGGA